MDPIKIGWLGSALDGPDGGYDRIHRLAFDEAMASGVLGRPYEFVLHAENGLPRGSAKNAIDGFKELVDEGCIAVAGAYSSDNAMVVGPYANEAPGAVALVVRHRAILRRVLLPAGQRRLRRRCGSRGRMVEAQRLRAGRGAQRGVSQR